MKRVRFYDSPVLNIPMPMWRARLVLILLMLGLGAVVVKALYLQGMSKDFLQQQGERRYERTLVLPATRGKIFDRTGEVVLASTIPVRAIWAIPEDAKEASGEQLAQLGKLLEMPVRDIQGRLANEDKNFVYIKRQVSVELADRIKALKIPGIHQQAEVRRFYPEGGMTAHVLGFTNIEDKGIEGVELTFNEELSGTPGSRRVIRDRLGRVVEDVQAVVPPVDGQDLRLSIDAGLQFDAYSALKKGMEEHNAKAAAAIVLDVKTGEVLALVNLPTYDPNHRDDRKGAALRNRAITDTFEPGSIMKPFTVALALDLGKVTTSTKFDTGNGRYRYQGSVISDVSRNGVLDIAGILRRSSNIGMTMISERLTSQEMWTKFTELGFGRAPHTNFPGVASGKLRPWERWRPIERATMAYGYGLSASLLQVAHAYTVFARNGDMVSLTLLKRQGKPTSVQVYKPEDAALIRSMLEAAAGPDGAKLAQVQGYRVAGKSGTARKIVDGRYSTSKYRSSFVGFAPVSDPRIVVAVTLDEPQGGAYYGGRVAAPVFSNIVASSLRRMGVQPDAPFESLVAVGSAGEQE
ncbi:peptidoglycan D,D-transpeptidase FtsI family protein [Pusillimonas noertemannii]|uniref:Peptidoglycan D,D-transpeptidase FtsI n=1 Tax=Pusillimonas noertemannii TaxID=305977 RepID=A0A2U1CKL6_9BURK|nr:penicillin-binding protein 2 [Pusillimonas noertemannii]NYT69057.1 penicillin-binding protein 2 [Pusillimonas noertemannii]PVY61524.1 cell division protein FtsI (penicillin-binding protein 3) [Pusillimonas noertemannii]TFL09474.1 penicillin-binding protein 2 [Pusillimonas noertemannii]